MAGFVSTLVCVAILMRMLGAAAAVVGSIAAGVVFSADSRSSQADQIQSAGVWQNRNPIFSIENKFVHLMLCDAGRVDGVAQWPNNNSVNPSRGSPDF